MSGYTGPCCKLIEALQELMPNKFDDLYHHGHNLEHNSEICFPIIIRKLVYRAVSESELAVEYAIACHQITEIFQPFPIKSTKKNLFKSILRNELQTYFDSVRSSEPACKNHGTVKFIGELFNVGFLTRCIVRYCLKKLLLSSNEPSELDVEYFHILITTIGLNLESKPEGVALIDEFLKHLEHIIDIYGLKFSLRVRKMILDVFEQRGNGWAHNKIRHSSAVGEHVMSNSKHLEAAKSTHKFLKELSEVLSRLEDEKVLNLMDRLMVKQFQSENELAGVANIIFEHVVTNTKSLSLYAMLFKGLADVSTPTEKGPVTFKDVLMMLCQLEIESQRKGAVSFRFFSDRMRTFKTDGKVENLSKLKEALEGNLKFQTRSHRVASFFGELSNLEIVGSLFVSDYLSLLISSDVISNTSIESFCLLITLVAPKMLTEKNHDFLLKDNILKLRDASKTINTSSRVRFLIKDLLSFGRIQLKLSIDNFVKKEVVNNRHSVLSTFCPEKLWTSHKYPPTQV